MGPIVVISLGLFLVFGLSLGVTLDLGLDLGLFLVLGLFLFGVFFLGSILKGVGALVAAIGLGQIIAGYLYPNTSEEITLAVDAVRLPNGPHAIRINSV